ncbi:MAG: YmaF family [Clostridiales bacterium]|jgi:hypothetical protein|nr:YmaF family [Clostridiales bacterium]MDK2934390.1 YmaF family [Clostridiales bacterium]
MLTTKHSHSLELTTSKSNEHQHLITGRTLAEYKLNNHRHEITGVVEGEDGHKHPYNTVTGLAIHLPDGSHFHNFKTVISHESHEHVLKGSTSVTKI